MAAAAAYSGVAFTDLNCNKNSKSYRSGEDCYGSRGEQGNTEHAHTYHSRSLKHSALPLEMKTMDPSSAGRVNYWLINVLQ